MLFRDGPDASIAITQPSHAWLSGQIIRAWGNAAFGAVTPYEDVCLGAEQHDIGWLVWEQSPTLDPATGRPHSFRDLGIASHTALWGRGTEMALALGRYPALLVSLHGTSLYAGFSGSAEDAAIVRAFVEGQQAIQRRLMASLDVPPAEVERNRLLVRAADRMSIAICTAMRDVAIGSGDPHAGVVKGVPTAEGETDIRLRLVDGDPSAIAVAPWPFATSEVSLLCEGILLPSRLFSDEAEMRAALRDAARVVLSADLRPD